MRHSVVTQADIMVPGVSPPVSIPDLKDRFSPVRIYIAGIHGLGNTAPLTAVGWSKGNELACPAGR